MGRIGLMTRMTEYGGDFTAHITFFFPIYHLRSLRSLRFYVSRFTHHVRVHSLQSQLVPRVRNTLLDVALLQTELLLG